MKPCIDNPAAPARGAARRWLAAAACAFVLCACGGGSSGQGGGQAGGQAGSGAAPPPAAAAAPAPDLSGADSSAALQAHAEGALKGKTIAWVPLAMGLPLTEIWTRVMREEAQARGMRLEVRDPNWNTTAALQALSALIGEKPALIVVHNPNVQLYAKELKRAEEAGIPVIQVNMVSNYKTAAYIGPDWHEVGRLLADEIIHQCGGGSGQSGKVSIVQGEQTSGVSIEQMEGLSAELATDKAIQVVSSQAANWDTTKAHDITATVLQQHPDLCASVGFWSGMEIGAAEAIKSAGKLGQVKVYASGGEGKVDCQNVDNGLLTKVLSYDAPDQAKAVIQVASFILQSGARPDAFRAANYSTLHWMEKGKYDPALCYDWNNQWRDYADSAPGQ
ncbi:MAG: sugar ABC transporter substrate-binding protein [Nevskia sp.]|nr:sugar ABC transporter substrate-binding protein [Nevskia sp.]